MECECWRAHCFARRDSCCVTPALALERRHELCGLAAGARRKAAQTDMTDRLSWIGPAVSFVTSKRAGDETKDVRRIHDARSKMTIMTLLMTRVAPALCRQI